MRIVNEFQSKTQYKCFQKMVIINKQKENILHQLGYHINSISLSLNYKYDAKYYSLSTKMPIYVKSINFMTTSCSMTATLISSIFELYFSIVLHGQYRCFHNKKNNNHKNHIQSEFINKFFDPIKKRILTISRSVHLN